MQYTILEIVTRSLGLLLVVVLVSCGGTKLLNEPQSLVLERPLTSTSDQRLEAHLNWVIVRGGPGTWVKGADWDEYLLRVRNLSDEPIRITGVAVYDSLETRLDSSANINKLIGASRKTARRYRKEGLKVKAGVSGDALSGAGATLLVGGNVLGMAVFTGAASVNAAGVALGALALAPVLIVGGMIQSSNKDLVARKIIERYTPLPVSLSPGELHSLTVFVPLAPSPKRVEISYSDSSATHIILIDTQDLLRGLHIDSDK